MPGLSDNLHRGKQILSEHNNIWALLAMSVVIAALIVAWWAVSDTFSLSGIGKVEDSSPVASVNPPVVAASQTDEISALTDTLRDLNETARMLMDSITYLESKLIRAHVLSDDLIENNETLITAGLQPRTAQPGTVPSGRVAGLDSLPPPAAGPAPTAVEAPRIKPVAKSVTAKKPAETAAKQTAGKKRETAATRLSGQIKRDTVTAPTAGTAQKTQPAGKYAQTREPEAGKTQVAAVTETPTRQPKPAATKTQPTAPKKQADAAREQSGAWIINLASMTSRKQAENFQSKAGMKGLNTSIHQARVKGREYWRVRVTGLASQEEAKSYGEEVRQRLGLKEIWISRR